MTKKKDIDKDIFGKLPTLGRVSWLYTQSPNHKHYFMGDMEWLLLPPLQLDQCKLYMNDDTPVAYVSWAYVSDNAQQKYIDNGADHLAPKDWQSGDNLWLIDVVAPFGGMKEIVEDLRNNLFLNKVIKMVIPDPESNKKKVITLGDSISQAPVVDETIH